MTLNRSALLAVFMQLSACAVVPDHFYVLSALPDTAPAARSTPTSYARLDVTVPALVDRREMVLDEGNDGIRILDHERWAAPIADQVTQTLARDIELRRAGVLIGDRRFAPIDAAPIKIQVDIVELSARQGRGAVLEARWRVINPARGTDTQGSGVFRAALGGGYGAVARAFSETLGALADQVAELVPAS